MTLKKHVLKRIYLKVEINFLLTTCNDAEEQALGEEQEQEVSDFVANVSTGLDEFFNKSRHC